MRLRTKYAAVLLAILLVLGTVVLATGELFKQQTEDREREDLDQTTRLATNQVDETIGTRANILTGYGAEMEMDQPRPDLLQLLNNTRFFSALVVDDSGTITHFEGDVNERQRTDAIGASIADEDLVVAQDVWAVLNGSFQGTARIGDLQPILDENGEPSDFVVMMTTPIIRDGEVTGALVGTVFISNADFFRALTPLETTTQTAQVRGTTTSGGLTTIDTADRSFEDSIRSSAVVDRTGWTVEVERDRGALTNQLQRLQLIQFGSLFLVFMTVFGLGYYQYRTTLQQTDKLLDGFDELTEGNFDHTLDLRAAEEWTQIGEGFNTMTSGLRSRESQIRERERRLSVLNRVLRHNLQNDMTVIQGYAEVLPSMDERDQREDASEKILQKSRGLVDHGKKARRLQSIMENAENGRIDVEIASKLLETIEKYEREYPDFTVETEGLREGWVEAVSGVEFGLEQLVDNAFEHNASDDPVVRVTIERNAEMISVTVEDNGSGIPDHELDVLTQDEETSLEHGSGIGLWLAYWAVVKSGGSLEFGDQEEGGHVTALLPATDPESDVDGAKEPGSVKKGEDGEKAEREGDEDTGGLTI